MRGWMDGGDWVWMTVMMVGFVVAIAAAVFVAVRFSRRLTRGRDDS
jgi:hypothetical protein